MPEPLTEAAIANVRKIMADCGCGQNGDCPCWRCSDVERMLAALDAARAREVELTKENHNLKALADAVGTTSCTDVPKRVYDAWKQPADYWSSETARLRARVAELEALNARLAARLAAASEVLGRAAERGKVVLPPG